MRKGRTREVQEQKDFEAAKAATSTGKDWRELSAKEQRDFVTGKAALKEMGTLVLVLQNAVLHLLGTEAMNHAASEGYKVTPDNALLGDLHLVRVAIMGMLEDRQFEDLQAVCLAILQMQLEEKSGADESKWTARTQKEAARLRKQVTDFTTKPDSYLPVRAAWMATCLRAREGVCEGALLGTRGVLPSGQQAKQ